MSGNYDDSVGVEVSSDSFWEIGNYKRTVRRIDDGHRLCSDLMNCIHERARIEKSYALQLTEWSKRWKQLVEKGPQYGTVEKAWHALMTEAERVSELHLEVKNALMSEDFEKIKNWQKEAFHKQMIGGFKETKEADDGFRKAQKPWAKKLKEVEGSKKAYHAACKEEKLATSRETNSKADPALNPEQLKKLQDKVERSKQDVQKLPIYLYVHKQLYMKVDDKTLLMLIFCFISYANIYQDLEYSIKSADVLEDLKWFQNNNGPGMSMNWPQFEKDEEWSADLNRTLSRREKKKPGEGVTLTGINQTGEPSTLQNKHSSHLSIQSVQSSNNPFEDEEESGSVHEKEDSKDKNVSSYEKSYPTEWSDDESNNPFTANDANGDSNPFDDEAPAGLAVRVRALYDYEGQEHDELSFKAGEELTKMEDEDEQGWCKGRLAGGQVGLYPANYVESVQ
ncbi:hypothetical protein FKM82_011541 [Ascaphus truei]